MNNLTVLYPIVVVQSRYGGIYEDGSAWHALPNADAGWMWSDAYSEYMFGGDEDAVAFWTSTEADKVGRGQTPNAAVLDLVDRHRGVRQLDNDDTRGETQGALEEGSGSQNGQAETETTGLLP